jgi:hypothetical protein
MRTLDDIADAELPLVVPGGDVIPAVPSGAIAGPQPRHRSVGGREYYQTTLKAAEVPEWATSDKKTIVTPPEKHPGAGAQGKRPSVFKRFFIDLRKTASVSKLRAPGDSPDAPTTQRRVSLFNKASIATFATMTTRPSFEKLRRKRSQATITSRPSGKQAIQARDLEVTNFMQTPYAQRIANTKRAEANHIRALVDEALDDDDDNDTIFGFELDVPDHLPNSPLCPLNPKHKSGGKAICPLHGRRRRPIGLWATRAAAKTNVNAASAPVIVYEGGVVEHAERKGSQKDGMDGARKEKSLEGISPGSAWYS